MNDGSAPVPVALGAELIVLALELLVPDPDAADAELATLTFTTGIVSIELDTVIVTLETVAEAVATSPGFVSIVFDVVIDAVTFADVTFRLAVEAGIVAFELIEGTVPFVEEEIPVGTIECRLVLFSCCVVCAVPVG